MANIRKDTITRDGQHFLVSTVCLESMHFGGEYETMVFPCDTDGNVTDWGDLHCDRYETYEQAVAGHAGVVLTFQPLASPFEAVAV